MSTLPPTAYLLTVYDIVRGTFDSLDSIARHLGISVDDEGVITFRGQAQLPSYVIKDEANPSNAFTKAGAINDWARYHMCDKLPAGYRIYRVLK